MCSYTSAALQEDTWKISVNASRILDLSTGWSYKAPAALKPRVTAVHFYCLRTWVGSRDGPDEMAT
jgi:hypothetical protein